MTLTLTPHLRHRWNVVETKPGRLSLHCAKCGKTGDLEKLNKRLYISTEKMVVHHAQDVW
ncbi:MAG TPA: hypothetical protein VFG72_06160 [Marmoricola sp.]|nr:hypothetical protein [Marmoricola sp.]